MKKDRRELGTLGLILCALFAMESDALGLFTGASAVRNAAAGLLVLVFLIRLISPTMRAARGWMAPSMILFLGWIAARVFYDTGITLVPLLLILWFPLLFFIGYRGRGLSTAAVKFASLYAVVASLTYVAVALGDGVRGPQAINAIFYPLLALPFVIELGKGKLAMMAFGAIAFATLTSEKRTAVIALIVALAVAGLARWAASKRVGVHSPKPLVLAVVLVVGVWGYRFVASHFEIDVLEKFSRLSEDQGSGRSGIYAQVIELLQQVPLWQLLLGQGQDAVARAIGVSAHNDFLEVAYDFGLIGLALLLGVLLGGIGVLSHLMRSGDRRAAPMAASLGLFVVMAMLSHVVFVPTYVALIAFYWGSCLAAVKREGCNPPREQSDDIRDGKVVQNG